MCLFNPFAEIDFDSFPTKEARQQQCKHFLSCFSFCSYSEHNCINLDVSNGEKIFDKNPVLQKTFTYRIIMEDVCVPQMHFEDGWLQTHISYPEPFIIYYI